MWLITLVPRRRDLSLHVAERRRLTYGAMRITGRGVDKLLATVTQARRSKTPREL
jgi:hypothetical protein